MSNRNSRDGASAGAEVLHEEVGGDDGEQDAAHRQHRQVQCAAVHAQGDGAHHAKGACDGLAGRVLEYDSRVASGTFTGCRRGSRTGSVRRQTHRIIESDAPCYEPPFRVRLAGSTV
jgi:hypothetical protein